MYYEEKMIYGILHYRSDPQAYFVPYDIKELSRRHVNLQIYISTLMESERIMLNFEEYEEGWCNPCPDMSDILHFFDKNGESLCRKWKRWAGIVEKNPSVEKFLCKKCVVEHESIPTAS